MLESQYECKKLVMNGLVHKPSIISRLEMWPHPCTLGTFGRTERAGAQQAQCHVNFIIIEQYYYYSIVANCSLTSNHSDLRLSSTLSQSLHPSSICQQPKPKSNKPKNKSNKASSTMQKPGAVCQTPSTTCSSNEPRLTSAHRIRLPPNPPRNPHNTSPRPPLPAPPYALPAHPPLHLLPESERLQDRRRRSFGSLVRYLPPIGQQAEAKVCAEVWGERVD